MSILDRLLHSDRQLPARGVSGGEGASPDVRAWHHDFAHRALLHLALNQAGALRQILEQRARDLPALVMARVAESTGLDEEEWRRHSREIAIFRATFAASCWIVQMPVPVAAGEAHFVGILPAGDIAHYFTLELAEGGKAAFCLRDPSQGRLELGELPAATLAEFEAAIARELAPAQRMDAAGGNGAQPTAKPKAPASDVIDRDNLSREHLLAILDSAMLDTSLHGERSILVIEGSVNCLVAVPEGRSDYLTFSACWTLKPDVPRETVLERINDLNNGYVAVRATLVGSSDLLLELQLLLPAAISRKYLVLALRRFATISREAVDATCKGILA